ncbi:hypothetical protein L6469_12365 [Segatella baroniae B14]|uniref:Membrane protein n=3 Tax=Prevotellaceae TaxID=171552 RepID=D8DU18_9BACT|nr:hypothetical protein [Segatella baroniae]EFI73076.1 membrane protein [Segatella baroniae B14]UKK79934.1 hypothetical protein L6469_12365 [Segatella baroniae B14]GJG28535.1 hypothetical protein PRRU23_22350 [Segatella bryantii]SEQ20643.1 hypothetical protein SAMN05444375_106136 [Segatella baroniae B14]
MFTLGNKLESKKASQFIGAFSVLFLLTTLVRLISAQELFNKYLEYAFLALIIGLLIANTIKTPLWLKPALQTEFYITFVLQPTLGVEQTGDIIKHLGQFKNWAFALAFTSIGLETNFKELGQKVEGGKPIALYIIGQLFNIALTYFVVWVLLSGRFFSIPSIQL